MQITKAGFYDLSLIKDTDVTIAENILVSIFDDGKERNIFLQDNSNLNFYFVGEEKALIFQDGEASKLSISGLLFAKENISLDAKIFVKVLKDNCDTNVRIVSVAGENSSIKLDGVISIAPGLKNLNSNLKEENIFISETGKIEASPRLEVASNDVKASHSCKVEKVNKDKKFYLESRGLNDKEATKLILEANINSLFLDLENKKNILSQILEF